MTKKYTKSEIDILLNKRNIKLVSNYCGYRNKQEFICYCGKKFITTPQRILLGNTKSCGCYQKKRASESNSIDLTNKKFGLLLVLERYNSNNSCTTWKCLCDCGQYTNVRSYSLINGHTKSCGCLKLIKNSSHPLWGGIGEISRSYFCQIQHGAKVRNLEFNISLDFMWNLFIKQNRKCALTNLDIEFIPIRTSSLDRIDSNLGYIENNIHWVHKDINLMKHKLSKADFIKWCKLITNYKNA